MLFNIFTSILAFAAIVISAISLAEKKKVGPQGPKGDKGDKGDPGLRGAKGPKGDSLVIEEIDIKDIPFISVNKETHEIIVNGTIKYFYLEEMPKLNITPYPDNTGVEVIS